MTLFKKRSILRSALFFALALLVTTGLIALLSNYPGIVRADSKGGASPVGVWFVNAVGAPFQPHIVTFHSDGTMIIDNPEAGDPNTSDSAGMGPWQMGSGGNIVGEFEEINASRTTNAFVSTLIVTFTITVTNTTFTGPAQATYYNPNGTVQAGPLPATLNGTLLVITATPSVGTITGTSSPVAVNTSVTASATFTDPGDIDTPTAQWNWGDGNTTTGTVTESNGSGSVSNSHTYTSLGAYTIILTLTDNDGENSA